MAFCLSFLHSVLRTLTREYLIVQAITYTYASITLTHAVWLPILEGAVELAT